MNLDILELEKKELLDKSKMFIKALQGCFNDRKSYSKNCIFNKNTNNPSSDIAHRRVENELKDTIKKCNRVYSLTSNDNKWKNKIEKLYNKKYPTDNIYEKPISPRQSKRSRSKRKSNRKSKRTSKRK